MIHALVLGLVIAIVLIILIQKVTSGFTAAECDARYTLDYRACNDTYQTAKRACRGRDKTSCEQTALRAKEACTDAAASAKITCLGPAAAAGDVVATRQLQDAQRRDERRSSPPAITGGARVTPGAAFTPAESRGNQGGQGDRGDRGGQGDRGDRGAAAPAPSAPIQGRQAALSSPEMAISPPPMVASPPPMVASPPPVPAPAEAPSALQMAACDPGTTEVNFPGLGPNESTNGGTRSLNTGEPVCRKPAPGPFQCDFAAGYIYHSGGAVVQPECLKPRIA
jgi:hypothetical protein